MNRSLKIYIALLVLVFVAIVYLDAIAPKPINWTPTYSIKDKIPYGLYVFDHEIGSVLKNQKIEKLNITPYEYFYDRYDYDTLVEDYKVKGTFLNISEYSTIDNESVEEICNFVSHGNTAFLSSKSFPGKLLDSLKLELNGEYNYKDSIYNWVANKKLGNQKYKII